MTTSEHPRPFHQLFISPLVLTPLIFLSMLLVYLPSLNYSFVWDDEPFILQNPAIRDLANIPSFFTDVNTFVGTSPGKNLLTSWRPIRNISFAIDYQLHRFNPAGWHLHNVLLHGVVVTLLFWLMLTIGRLLFRGGICQPILIISSLLAALWWGAHPVNTEVVAYVKSRDDLLATGFLLLFALLFVCGHYKPRPIIWFSFACGTYVLSLLSKESTFSTFPAFALLSWFIYKARRIPPRNLRSVVWVNIAVAVLSVAYVIIRHFLNSGSAQSGYLTGSFFTMQLTMLPAAVRYTYLALWPYPPNFFVSDYAQYPVILTLKARSLWIYLALFIAIVYNMGLWAASGRVQLFGVILLLTAYVPISNVIPMVQIMAERFMYTPLVGVAIAIAGTGFGSSRWRPSFQRLAFFVMLSAVAANFYGTSQRAEVYRNAYSLYKTAYEQNPYGERPAYNYAYSMIGAEGHTTAALTRAKEIIKDLSAQYDHDLLRAHIHIFEGETTKSRELIRQAMESHPARPLAYHMESYLYIRERNFEEAEKKVLAIIEKKFDRPDTWYNLALIRWNLGDYAGALSALDTLEQVDKDHRGLPSMRAAIKAEMGTQVHR